MSEIIGYLWTTNMRGTIGLVATYDERSGEHRAYISYVTGDDQEIDLQIVKLYGAKFPVKGAHLAIDEAGTWLRKPEYLKPDSEFLKPTDNATT